MTEDPEFLISQSPLNAVNVSLLAIYDNLVDAARRSINDGPPARPNNALLALTTQYTGNRTYCIFNLCCYAVFY